MTSKNMNEREKMSEKFLKQRERKRERKKERERDSFVMRKGECTLNEFSFCCAKSRFFLNVKETFCFIFLFLLKSER